jgi:hypothetical protein
MTFALFISSFAFVKPTANQYSALSAITFAGEVFLLSGFFTSGPIFVMVNSSSSRLAPLERINLSIAARANSYNQLKIYNAARRKGALGPYVVRVANTIGSMGWFQWQMAGGAVMMGLVRCKKGEGGRHDLRLQSVYHPTQGPSITHRWPDSHPKKQHISR